MMNFNKTQLAQTIPSNLPQPPELELPQFPLDPTNPLIWILLITALLGNADEVINAATKLTQAIASFRRSSGKSGKGRRSDRNS